MFTEMCNTTINFRSFSHSSKKQYATRVTPHFPNPTESAIDLWVCLCSLFYVSLKMEPQGPLWLISFTGHSVFKVHPHYCMYKCCISFYCYIIFHCLDTPHFNHPFSLWTQVVSTLWLLWITLIWIFMYKFLCEHAFSFLSIHPK